VTNSRAATRHVAPSTVVEISHRLTCGLPFGSTRCDRVPAPVDVERLLLETASIVLAQLRVLRSLVGSTREAHELVIRIQETAGAHGIAPAGAIGATGVLADMLCQPCEPALAEALVRMRDAFTDEELINGAASLLAATSAHLADRLELDPTTIVEEVARQLATGSAEATHRRPMCRRHLGNA